MAHPYSDSIDLKLNRLLAVRRSTLPLHSDGEAIRLLVSTQDALHALVCARDERRGDQEPEVFAVPSLTQ